MNVVFLELTARTVNKDLKVFKVFRDLLDLLESAVHRLVDESAVAKNEIT